MRQAILSSVGGAGLHRSFEEACKGLTKRFLRDIGFVAVVPEEGDGRRIAGAGGDPKGDEVDFLSTEPFAFGEFALYLKSVKTVKRFLSKIERVKEKVGKDEPFLVLIAFRAKAEVLEERPLSFSMVPTAFGRSAAGRVRHTSHL